MFRGEETFASNFYFGKCLKVTQEKKLFQKVEIFTPQCVNDQNLGMKKFLDEQKKS